jgi:thiol-disulfide isomerase/thioredoxin
MRVTALAIVLVGAAACGRTEPVDQRPSGRLDRPAALESFPAVDLDGQDRSPTTWAGRVVVLNVWATWCAPCRREMPALQALQDKFRGRVLMIGLLQDQVSDDFARQFLQTAGVSYPIVRSTFAIESRLPAVLLLPTTFVVDAAGHLVAAYTGEINPAVLEADLVWAQDLNR